MRNMTGTWTALIYIKKDSNTKNFEPNGQRWWTAPHWLSSKEKMSVDSWPVFRHLIVFVYIYVPFLNKIFRQYSLDPENRLKTLYKYSGKLPWFLAVPDSVSVRSRRWKRTWHRLLEGRDLEKLGQEGELSIQNARHHDHTKEMGGEMPSS